MGDEIFLCADRLGKSEKELRIKILRRNIEQAFDAEIRSLSIVTYFFVTAICRSLASSGRIKAQLAFFAVNDIVELYVLCVIIKSFPFWPRMPSMVVFQTSSMGWKKPQYNRRKASTALLFPEALAPMAGVGPSAAEWLPL